MDIQRLSQIRQAEARSHTDAYENHDLFAAGSWLAKPVRTVVELLPLFDGYNTFRALDLGSGVGRNSIPVARYFGDIPCRVECVDILELAIRKLKENAGRYGVADAIYGFVSPMDDYSIEAESYDLILAVSALEHMDSEAAFTEKLREIRAGLREGGIACLIVNTGVQERSKTTGEGLLPQFEVNFQTNELLRIMEHIFEGFQLLKQTVVHQQYDIPRENIISQLETDVVTYVVRKG